MSKFSEILTLLDYETAKDAEGVVRQTPKRADVFFNRYSISLANRMAGASEGLFGMVEGEVRSVDYAGQKSAVINGEIYTVDGASDRGEFTLLTMSRKLRDGKC